MTRLITEWIEDIGRDADPYGQELKQKTGLSYDDLLIKTCSKNREELKEAKESSLIAVVPITTGEGLIGSFGQSVAAIIRHMGFQVLVTENTDVAGIYEAGIKGAEILFMADDDRYIALNIRSGRISNNDEATARGFVTILGQMTKDIAAREVLVLGAGTVGSIIIKLLKQQGETVFVYDKNREKTSTMDSQDVIEKSEIRKYKKIIDATSEGGWLKKDMIGSGVKLAALGVPFSLDEEAEAAYGSQAFYDCLATGTAVMLGEVI